MTRQNKWSNSGKGSKKVTAGKINSISVLARGNISFLKKIAFFFTRIAPFLVFYASAFVFLTFLCLYDMIIIVFAERQKL